MLLLDNDSVLHLYSACFTHYWWVLNQTNILEIRVLFEALYSQQYTLVLDVHCWVLMMFWLFIYWYGEYFLMATFNLLQLPSFNFLTTYNFQVSTYINPDNTLDISQGWKSYLKPAKNARRGKAKWYLCDFLLMNRWVMIISLILRSNQEYLYLLTHF